MIEYSGKFESYQSEWQDFFRIREIYSMTLIRRCAVAVAVFAFLNVFALHAAGQPINVGLVPDGISKTTAQDKAPLIAYLAKSMGRQVSLVLPPTYNDTIEALGKGSIDFALLGALAYVKAHKQYEVIPLVQRTADLQFHTLFICGANSGIRSLQDLAGKKFAFGDVNSASGHLIPYLELRQAGVDPDNLQYRYSGSHGATAKLVESGAVDAGSLDEAIYKSMIAEGKLDRTKVRAFYTTKPFVDYVWVARKDLDKATQEKFVQAFLSLKEGQNEEVLQVLRGNSFVRANNEEYAIVRLVAQQLKMM
jgi:phosphonate transport system substrate-binding protein